MAKLEEITDKVNAGQNEYFDEARKRNNSTEAASQQASEQASQDETVVHTEL